RVNPPAPELAPASPPAASVAEAKPSGATVVALRPTQTTNNANSVLGRPVGPVAPPTPPAVVPAKGNDLLSAIGEVQKTEKRFSQLTVDLKNGVVAIGGSAPQASDAWDFARKVQSVPGVTRIAVGAVAVK